MAVRTSGLGAGEHVDHYRIVRLLGSGGFSETYEAIDERKGTRVVLKVPSPVILGDPQTFERFRREMAITRKLDHPNIQRSLDDGTSRSQPYLVLEYVEGEPLRRHLRGRLPLPVDEAVDYSVQLCRALAHAHTHGVAHRDLKPENILVAENGKLILFDFGIALLAGARRVTWRWVGSQVGTPDYMAPEQIQGKRGDERTDIYALGIMLYEMLAGRVPFRGDNALAVMSQALNKPPPPLRDLSPTVPEPLAAVVHKAIRKEPAERYATAEEMLFDLEHLDQVDVAALQLSPETAGRKPVSDRQLLVYGGLIGLAFIVFVVAVIGIVILVEHH